MSRKILPALFALAILLFFYSLECSAVGMGPPMGPMGGGPPPCWPPPCNIPVDSGISILIAAGVALGGKKLFDLRKK